MTRLHLHPATSEPGLAIVATTSSGWAQRLVLLEKTDPAHFQALEGGLFVLGKARETPAYQWPQDTF